MPVLDGPTSALRERSPELLRRDLLALLIDGADEWRKDDRDLMLALAPYHHCARLLGADPAALFGGVAEAAPEELARTVREFGARDDIEPAGWNFSVVDTGDGPAFRRGP